MKKPSDTEARGAAGPKAGTGNSAASVDIGDVPLHDLLGLEHLTPILEDFCNAVGIASAIIDLEGNVLAHARWQRICTAFHRVDKRTCARCIESDTELAENLQEGKQFSIYRCKNGLTDAASPIVVEGRHVANAFVGQFLLREPDRGHFMRQAEEFGFDAADYLRALDEVPIVSQEKLTAILGFLTGFARLVASLSLERIKALVAETTCKVSVRDSEEANRELILYKSHLENLVEDRTERLKQSEEYSRLILQSVAEGIFGTDLEGRCTFANEAAQKMLDYPLGDIIGRSIHDLFHHSNADGSPHVKEDCPIHLAYSRGITSFRRDEVFWRKDGSFFDVSYTSVPQRVGDAITGSVVVFRDISARKKAEDAIAESEYRLKTILTTANEGFWWVDNDARTLDVNNTMCRFLGRPREEILGRTVFEFLDQENTAVMREQLRRRATGETGIYEIALDRPDGSQVLCLFHATPLYDKNGVKTGSFAMITDMTRHKRMEEELIVARNRAEAATRAKSDFLANMSHEIRTPMNAVLGMTHIALNTDLTPKQREYLTKIQISANSLLGVINDILDFSKIEAGKMSMECIGFNLDEVLENLSTQITIKAQEKEGLEVLFRTEPDVPRSLVGDPLRLGQVLINLTNNAIKFTDQGEIVVSTELVDKTEKSAVIQFSVRDTGIGLTEDQVGRLFDAFSQADTSVTRKYGGSGLGLTICKRLVEMMGGRIWVESKPGVGSTFFFTAVFDTGRDGERAHFVPPPDLKGINALVVDDNPTSCDIFQRMLESFSFRVTLAKSGEAALLEIEKSFDKEPFDIVIMDWKLPGMDGIEASNRIKKIDRLPRVPPIILVSAYGREEILWRAEAAGLDGFLIKPVRASVMFDAIMHALARETSKELRPGGQNKQQSADVLRQLEGTQVLLVEDNPINQQVAMEILSAAGVVVSLACDGREAVDAVKMKPYDAVLMDIQMPGMDGYSATLAIRRDTRFKGLPIIAMTAHAMAGDYEKSIGAGMNDHITKPIDPEKLFETLARWISAGRSPAAGKGAPEPPPRKATAAATADAAPAPAQKPPFPAALEGFALSRGLHNLLGNTDLYRKLLINFADNYTHKPDAVRRALDAGEYRKAHQLLHDIKGLAGNLAAFELQAAAAELVNLVKHADRGNPPSPEAVTRAMAAFTARMDLALRSARRLKPETAGPGPEPPPESPGQLPPGLAREAARRLGEAAGVGDVSGVAAIAREMASRSEAFGPYGGSIARMLEDFDFDGILGLADELSKTEP